MLLCPVCNDHLVVHAVSYVCGRGHSFDIAKQGYVNLVVGAQKKGDDSMMVDARCQFLSTGSYTPLIHYIADVLSNTYEKHACTIAHIGCGEGWYMRALQHMRHDVQDTFIGLDISKEAVKSASKHTTGTFVVGNAYDLPLGDASLDVVVSIFSPWSEEEISRCLKKDGIAIIVSPGVDHLYAFIQMIRDNPHQHRIRSRDEAYSLLALQKSDDVRIPLSLENNKDIVHLFSMTPYYRKAPKIKQEKILALDSLDTQAHFLIDVLRK